MTTIRHNVYLNAQPVELTPNVFDARLFGASASNVDNYGPILGTMNAAHELGGGIVELGPETYNCLSYLQVPDGVSLRGVPGETKLDFSAKTTFESSFTAGLIRANGSLGTAVALTQSTKRTIPIVFRFLAAARSTTTVTAETDMAHGLSVGDPIWVTGNPATVAQGVFYTVNQAIGLSARTTPFIVATVPDSTHITYAVANTGDTTLTVSEDVTTYCYFASDVILVASSTGFAAGQDVMIRSQAYRSSASLTEQNHIGEFNKVARVIGSTMVLLHSDVQDDYAVSDTAQIVPVTFQRGFAVEGIEVIGKGANTGSGYGDRGIVAYLCEAPRIESCKVTNVDQAGIYIWSCISGAVRENLITFDGSDEAGFASSAQDIAYGIAFAGCTTGLEIAANCVYGGRHAIVQTMTSNASFHGVCRNISITGNTLKGQYLAAIASHQGVDTLAIIGNNIAGGQGGINPRYSRDVVMAGNIITAYGYGIYCYNYVGNFTAAGNAIRAGQWGIRAGRDVDAASQYGPFKIVDNNVEGGEYGIYVFDETAGVLAIDIDISGNTTRNTKYEGIRVTIGDGLSADEGWTGKVNGNTVIDCGQIGSRNGMWFTNFRGGQASGNNFQGSSQIKYAFHLEGVATGDGLLFLNTTVAAGLLTDGTIDADAGFWHRTDLSPLSTADALITIAAGAINPRLAQPMVIVDTEAAAASDDLDTIRAGTIGQTLVLRTAANARVVTVKDNVGNIQTAGSADRVLDNTRDTLTLIWSGASWNELAFASS